MLVVQAKFKKYEIQTSAFFVFCSHMTLWDNFTYAWRIVNERIDSMCLPFQDSLADLNEMPTAVNLAAPLTCKEYRLAAAI